MTVYTAFEQMTVSGFGGPFGPSTWIFGIEFRVSAAATLTAVWSYSHIREMGLYRVAGQVQVHTENLPDTGPASGGAWRRYPLTSPPALDADVPYVLAVRTGNSAGAGGYFEQNGFFTGQSITNGPLHVPSAETAAGGTQMRGTSNSPTVAFPSDDVPAGRAVLVADPEIEVAEPQGGGGPWRAWTGTQWAEGELKGWTGSAWAPVRAWDGTNWIPGGQS